MNLQDYLRKQQPAETVCELVSVITGAVATIKSEFLGGDEKTGIFNIYGEEEIKIDKKANQILIDVLSKSGLVSQIASEEEKEILQCNSNRAHFAVTLDPLDGSSLIPTALAVGTIISIYGNGDVLSGLGEISAAFYILYGPLTLIVFADQKGVSQFVQDKNGVFQLVKEKILIPDGNLYGSGGLRKDWLPGHKKYIETLENEGYKLRYSGSGVADIHQILTYGGVFSYPALQEKPQGKLRLLIEVGPWCYIIEKAGGLGTNGKTRILELTPQKVDERTPVYVGSKNAVRRAAQFLEQ